jgi:hypothetical protein
MMAAHDIPQPLPYRPSVRRDITSICVGPLIEKSPDRSGILSCDCGNQRTVALILPCPHKGRAEHSTKEKAEDQAL